jgi:alpha-tubulin suppressor-like RCC1 family protein
VVEWLRHIGFESYVKIAKVEKLNGMKLKNIDKKYMNDALGITTQNMQHKLLMCVDEIINRKSNNDQLWGWGRNDNGQLGSSSANFVARPQKIRLNCMH